MIRFGNYLSALVCGASLCFSLSVFSETNEETYPVHFGSFSKDYPMIHPKSSSQIKIAYLYDISDNLSLIDEASTLLCKKLTRDARGKALEQSSAPELIVMPGDGANLLGGYLVMKMRATFPNLDICIIRNNDKGGSFRSLNYQPITSSQVKSLHLREDQFHKITHKRIIIMDDIISSGATLRAIEQLVEQAKGVIIGYACIATEGLDRPTFAGKPLYNLINIPVLEDHSRKKGMASSTTP